MQADPYVSSNAHSLGSIGEPGHPPVRFCFLEGEASVRGVQTLTQGSCHVQTEWGNTPTYNMQFKELILIEIEIQNIPAAVEK